MSGTALALVLTAALLHATWNLAVKGAGGEDRVAFVWLYIAVCSAIWVPIGVVWVVVTGESAHVVVARRAAGLGVLHVVYQLALQRGYAEGDLNLVYPLARGAAPLLTFLFAVTVLDQHPGPAEVAGVLAVVGGVLLISFGGRAGLLTADQAGVDLGSRHRRDHRGVHPLGQPLRQRASTSRRCPTSC